MKARRAHKVREPRRDGARGGRTLLIVHAAELLTLRGPPGPRTLGGMSELGLIEDGAVFAQDGRIADVGTSREVLARHPKADRTIDASDRVVLPGFVDAHTHAIFAGSREREVEWKSQGLSYAEIAARGGGLLDTVRATRTATEDELADAGAKRLRGLRASGTTTVEVKSGYGLTTPDELKILRAARRAAGLARVDVVPTFLGAHGIPPEFEGRADEYVELVASEMVGAVARDRLASFCDVFVEGGYFTADQARRILGRARDAGLGAKVHADELSDSGGALLAGEMRAASADHLLHVSDPGIEALARAGVVGVLLPATSLASRLPFADGRKLVAAGVPVALGTDFNPNCWCESMPLAIALAAHHNGLLPAQAIVAATINAAHAVGRADSVGSLEPGKEADLVVVDVPSFRHIAYRLAGTGVSVVVKGGAVVEEGASSG